MTKIHKHQILFIIFSLVIIFISSFYGIKILDAFSFKSSDSSILIIFISLTLIGTIGVAHGALDGKIIWKHSVHIKTRFKLYLLYILLTLGGALLWFFYPFYGLMLLLAMSSVHFGVSDLQFIEEMSIAPKIFWGIVMTFLPLLFNPNLVNILFFDLTQVSIYLEVLVAIKIIILICMLSFFINLYLIGKNRKKVGKNFYELNLLSFEMLVLVCLAYYLNPLIWFAIYFCGLHGIRALINHEFKILPDIFWLVLFTAPISTIIFLFEWDYNFKSLLVIFPVLASLTIAHMLLPGLRKLIKP